MKLNINEVIAEMLDAVQDALAEDWYEIRDFIDQIMEQHKPEIHTAAVSVLKCRLANLDFDVILSNLSVSLQLRFLALHNLPRKIIQDAANAAVVALAECITGIVRSAGGDESLDSANFA